ncbi:hypothetical protein [Sphingobacterium yanglingense]|uniref:3-hydroxymyristoyl/3-hydroxydecanoyl-(Acyl carrier protein) dehydratase n=1 Tax=Sphingobacterium yanglingense TaxID=1437280 RepID=A0A4R6W9K1_9SPHI|nr:hypothetical protein [Sphingobacterium yanglingense]TDQ75861.1 3-hydroxymyristoyl/3-hydroxydecanoyl-(acyl carrier protein) dehydratase [Sphingobacterium yanglingense]
MLPVQGEHIIKLIPQRFPMVMIDRLLDYTAETVVVDFEIRTDNLFVAGGQLQESGLLEHMAQSVAAHTGYSYYIREEQAPTGYIGSIQKAEVHRLPLVGEVLTSKVEIIQEFMGVTLVHIETYIGQESIGSAQMKTVIASTG